MNEAEASMAELATVVTQTLESNREMSQRMARLEQQTFRRPLSSVPTINGRDATWSPSLAETTTADDTESIVTIRGSAQNARGNESRGTYAFSFDQDLDKSRPYVRAMKQQGAWSTTSSEIHTMGWSFLSGISLADVSDISVINLPIFPSHQGVQDVMAPLTTSRLAII